MQIPSAELAVKINKILNRNKDKLKEYQDRYGKFNFNLLLGVVLGGVCAFSEKPPITQILGIFMPIFEEKQLNDYANLMMGLNNYLVYTLDSNPNDLYLLENNKWVSITEASIDSTYALWHSFFGMMKVEFEQEKAKINKLKANPITIRALACFKDMSDIMTASLLDGIAVNKMQNEFPKYASKFNELRKLMYTQRVKVEATVH